MDLKSLSCLQMVAAEAKENISRTSKKSSSLPKYSIWHILFQLRCLQKGPIRSSLPFGIHFSVNAALTISAYSLAARNTCMTHARGVSCGALGQLSSPHCSPHHVLFLMWLSYVCPPPPRQIHALLCDTEVVTWFLNILYIFLLANKLNGMWMSVWLPHKFCVAGSQSCSSTAEI